MAEQFRGDGAAHDGHHAVGPAIGNRKGQRDDPDPVHLSEDGQRARHQRERERADGERAHAAVESELHDAAGDLHRADQRADEHGIARGKPAGGEQR